MTIAMGPAGPDSPRLAKLTTAAMSVLRISREEAIPLRAFADSNQWIPSRGLEILGFI